MDLSYFVYGSYTISLNASDFKRFWSICMYHGIAFNCLNLDENTEEKGNGYCCRIRCDYYEKIMEIAKKTQVEVQILQKHGLPFWLDKVKLHSYFFAGAVMALFLLFYLSGCLWNVQFDGNCYYGKEKIERFLSEKNIRCGMRMSDIDCAALSADIRSSFPRVTWASCEIDGCDLIIHIKENILIEEDTEQITGAYDLVAEKDGIVEKILIRQGIAQVETGQSVKKGDILISGYIPIENDAMEVIAYESVVSDGDVVISCDYAYYDQIERKYQVCQVIDEIKLPLIQIGEFYLESLWLKKTDSLEDAAQYLDEAVSKKTLSVTDTFHLPIQFGEKWQRIYEKKTESYTDTELEHLSEQHFLEFCANLEKKGVQIYENNVKMVLSDASCTRTGNVTVWERTGKLQKAQEKILNSDEMEE